MEEFAPEEDYITESQQKMINSILAEGFAAAHEDDRWYAVCKDYEDNDWGTGSYDYDEALKMAHDTDCKIIAVINEGYDYLNSSNDPICEELIEVEEA